MIEPTAISAASITRREFLRTASVAGGGLALTIHLPALGQEEGAPTRVTTSQGVRSPSAFIQIGADDSILITTPSVEMGQGAHTGMPMIIMEELGGDWARMKVQDAAAAAVYNNPMSGNQMTVGSFSVRGWYTDLRRVGAAAREMLVQTAAAEWNAPASECAVANSVITHRPSGRTLTFGRVAERAAKLDVPQNPALKSNDQFKVIGSFKPRMDVPAKVDGSAVYGIDVVVPDMLYAAVKTCPTFGGKLKSFDDSAAKNVKGYHATVPLSDGVIVVASNYWQAKKALEQVKIEYDLGYLADLDSAKVSARLRSGFDQPGIVTRNDGDVAAAFKTAVTVMEADYEVPYLAHACMEPMNCVARVDDSGCDVWCGTQAPQGAQEAAAAVLKIPRERVKVHVTYLGGGFGRRGESDYVTHAVTAANAVRRPVKLIWTREEDIQHDYYRPAAAIRFRGGLDAQGKLIALDCKVVTASAPNFGPGGAFYTGGISDAAYAIPNFRVTGYNADIGVRFGFWRSVNQSHNPFMLEGFIDEIARRTGQDPYPFRRSMLLHDKAKRQLQVLDLVAQKANWGKAPAGRHLGISAFEAFGSWMGAVADVSVKNKAVTLHRVVTAIDCGTVIYPDNVQAQLEGGMIYGLAAVLRGEISLQNGAVKQSNFHDYPMLMMKELPKFECHVVPSSAPPGGVGEPGTGPIAPALANAIFAATGAPVRSLPLSAQGFSYAAARA